MDLPLRQSRSTAATAEGRVAPSVQLYGQGQGGAPIYARAAVLQEDTHGRPTLSPELLIQTLHRRRRGEEDLDIVLIAADGSHVMLLPLPTGLHLVGIVSERELPPDTVSSGLALAVVSGVTGAQERISEGDLLIVDPEAGRVLVEPDALEFVRLQAERGHRPRVLLGASHVAATTQAGRIVAVWAEVRSFADVTRAWEAGADGLVILPGSELLPDDDLDPLPGLIEVAEQFGGGELTIAASLEEIDPAVLIGLAARAVVRWAIPHSAQMPFPLTELRDELSRLFAEELEAKRPAALPSLVGIFGEEFSRDVAEGWDEIVLDDSAAARLSLTDTFTLPPLRIRLFGDAFQREHATSLPVAGLVVPCDQVEMTKDFVREQEY